MGKELRLHLKDNVVDTKTHMEEVLFVSVRARNITWKLLMSNTERLSLTGWFLKKTFNN